MNALQIARKEMFDARRVNDYTPGPGTRQAFRDAIDVYYGIKNAAAKGLKAAAEQIDMFGASFRPVVGVQMELFA